MAFAPVRLSRTSLLKAAAFDLNGSSWVSSGSSLAPPRANALGLVIAKSVILRKYIVCSAIQESSTPTVSSEVKEAKPEVKDAKSEAKPAPAKPKPAAKAPVKPLPEMMKEDVIPSLRSILETQKDIEELELVFTDNRLEGSFIQNDVPYSFWAFFPDGNLTGPKGFALTSYGSEVSTIEPFLADEKKATAKHVVFWVEKRLAAQGIIPAWEQ